MELETYIQFALALVFVIALIGLLAAVARRAGLGYATPKKGGRRRLSITEVVPLDAKRRLVLVRRDATEHLVILGPAGETVVETGIATDDGGFPAALATAAGDQAPKLPAAETAE